MACNSYVHFKHVRSLQLTTCLHVMEDLIHTNYLLNSYDNMKTQCSYMKSCSHRDIEIDSSIATLLSLELNLFFQRKQIDLNHLGATYNIDDKQNDIMRKLHDYNAHIVTTHAILILYYM